MVRELRSHMPRGMAKKKKKRKRNQALTKLESMFISFNTTRFLWILPSILRGLASHSQLEQGKNKTENVAMRRETEFLLKDQLLCNWFKMAE